MQKRVWLFRAGFILAMLLIAGRLFRIQILQHDSWIAKAEEMHIVQSKIPATRGEIYMLENDEPVAVVLNQSSWTVVIDPQTANPEKTEKIVGELVKEQMVAKWSDIFANRNLRYYVAARNVTRDVAKKIREEELTGVYLIEGNSRVYPEGETGSTMLGFVNAEGEGQYGVEGALNEELAGKDGLLKTVTDVNNVALSIGDDNVRVPAEDGKNIVLTVDRGLERKIENGIRDYLKEKSATHASALVMDPRTGRVLAMATVPTYDATNYARVEDGSVYVNPVTEVAYEPASICKTFAFAAAIEEGKMTPETTYYNPGYFTIDSQKIENAYKGQLGEITMQTALNYSLNTGSMTALMLLGGSTQEITAKARETLYNYYYERFGLGKYTGIELYESPGTLVGPHDEVYGLNAFYANMTFGQNLQLSMIQVAAAFSSVVNGGNYYRPTIVAGEVTKDGEFVRSEQEGPVRRTISEETSATMRRMLYGTRNSRRLYGIDKTGYYIGGKTGTAQTIIDGAYSFDETVASYIGYGGTEGELPEYVIMVKIWEKGQKIEGEKDAMPLFDKLSNLTIDYLKIRPKGA
ncbi:penicillin-binding protein 2 [Candidatus Saccharibacteria bacterium]|nr:penicillin-binding protein 2 [Candidatus Saccharibacteria bacterium]